MSQVVHNVSQQRFEIALDDGEFAFADYRLDGASVVFPHTVVPPAHEGRGLASALAQESLAWARASGLKVIPACSFYRSYLDRHPEYGDLL